MTNEAESILQHFHQPNVQYHSGYLPKRFESDNNPLSLFPKPESESLPMSLSPSKCMPDLNESQCQPLGSILAPNHRRRAKHHTEENSKCVAEKF
mmetsp:Transcript_15060/g.26727  ORF Transcript_15060/g.26727 Transcript_15060/m.26727 type:complete len:95 (-) Transcript_15060:609-893(-)